MLSKLSKNQQRNTQKPKFSRLRRSQEQKVIQMCLYLYLYYKIILSELFLGILFWENPAAKRPGVIFLLFLGNIGILYDRLRDISENLSKCSENEVKIGRGVLKTKKFAPAARTRAEKN